MQSPANQERVVRHSNGQVERIVEAVEYHSSAGQGIAQKPTQIIHQTPPPSAAGAGESANSNTSGGVLTNAAASVVSTLESAKEAISRNRK